jgi:hypothetical protein
MRQPSGCKISAITSYNWLIVKMLPVMRDWSYPPLPPSERIPLVFRAIAGLLGKETGVIAVNDLVPVANLVKYDSTQGKFTDTVTSEKFDPSLGEDDTLVVGGQRIKCLARRAVKGGNVRRARKLKRPRRRWLAEIECPMRRVRRVAHPVRADAPITSHSWKRAPPIARFATNCERMWRAQPGQASP